MPALDMVKIGERSTNLLSGEEVEWVRQDRERHLTIRFKPDPLLLVGIPTQRKKILDMSVVADEGTRSAWTETVEAGCN